ncbi:hypothetical protein PG991_010897 [Apiospora marii]|uniref:Uncharacterized protein n=1 Tax=Apiospora marii TaxID=335849 RepID=A0ABR1RCS5_9PEZI
MSDEIAAPAPTPPPPTWLGDSSSSSSSSKRVSDDTYRSFWGPAGALTTVWTPTCTVFDTPIIVNYHAYTAVTRSSDPWWGSIRLGPVAGRPGGNGRPMTGRCARPDDERYSSLLGPALTVGETATICIPIGWECNTSTEYAEVTGPSTCIHTYQFGSTTNTGTYQESVPWVQIRWAASDLPRLETHPLTPGLIMNATLASAAALASARRAEASLQRQLGETRDAWAAEKAGRTRVTLGLAVAFGIVGLSLTGALLWLWIRYRKLRREAAATQGREMENLASMETATDLGESNHSLSSIRHQGYGHGDRGATTNPPPYSPRQGHSEGT